MAAKAVHRIAEEFGHAPRFPATVVSSVRMTPERADEIREIVLDIDNPEFACMAGQSIGVTAPADPERGLAECFRLYSVADVPERGESGLPRIKICVRRCTTVDANGDELRGIASNYLCDRHTSDGINISGPHGAPFEVPADHAANLILFCTGTGIAPFRAFVKHLYNDIPDWTGPVWLFHGAKNPLETLYRNDESNDFVNYYDLDTFVAFKALSPNERWRDSIPWDRAIKDRADELLQAFADPKTYVFVAGLESMRDGSTGFSARASAPRPRGSAAKPT